MVADEVSDDIVRLNDLTIEYPAHGPSQAYRAIHGLSIRLRQGEVLGLVGEAGAGKSTIARVVSGNADATIRSGIGPRIVGGDGVVVGCALRNIRGRQLRSLRRQVGVLPQNANATLPPDLTAGEIISRPAYRSDKRADGHEVALRVAMLVDAVKLPLRVIDQYPYELSNGQRQRVAIARSLILSPRLLIADDPTAGIDVTVREAVIDLVGATSHEREFSAIIISNDLSVLRRVTNRVAVLHRGVLVALGPIDEVLASPQHPYVAQIAAVDRNHGV